MQWQQQSCVQDMKAMSDKIADRNATDEQILVCDVADAVLEDAAMTVKERAGSFTLSFCSGLDTCPA